MLLGSVCYSWEGACTGGCDSSASESLVMSECVSMPDDVVALSVAYVVDCGSSVGDAKYEYCSLCNCAAAADVGVCCSYAVGGSFE